MAAMADWTDGPEYAPAQRPDAFAAPDAPALGPDATPGPDATAGPAAAPASPAAPPTSFALDADVRPLASLALAPEAGRDPREAFATSGVTREAPDAVRDPRQPLSSAGGPSGSAWGAAHTAFPPPTTAPIALAQPTSGYESPVVTSAFPGAPLPPAPAGFPTTAWPAPGAASYPQPYAPAASLGPRRVAFVDVIRSVGASMELLMLFMIWSTYLGPLLLLFTVQASRRVTVRRATVQRLVLGVTLASAALAVLGTWMTYGLPGDDAVQMLAWWWESWQALMMPTALLLLFAVNTVVAMGLRNGEGPQA